MAEDQTDYISGLLESPSTEASSFESEDFISGLLQEPTPQASMPTPEPTEDFVAGILGSMEPEPQVPAPESDVISKLIDSTKPPKTTLIRTPPSPPPESTPSGGGVPSQPKTTDFNEYVSKVRAALQQNPNDPVAQRRWDFINKSKDASIESAMAQGRAEVVVGGLSAVQNQLQQTLGGITFGISDVVLGKMRDAYGIDYTAQSTSEQVINSVGRMLGGVFSAQGLAKGMGSLTKKLGMNGVKQVLTTRLGTAGIAATSNALSGIATGNRDPKEAATDIAQNMAASLVGFGAEQAVPAGVKNWVAQVGADLVFDIVTDTARGRLDNQSFKDWFIKEELPQLAMSIAFATKDLTDANFEKQRVATVKELKSEYDRRFRASKVFDVKLTEQIATEIDAGRLASGVREAAEKLGAENYPKLLKESREQGVVGKNETPDKSEMVARLSQKAIQMARNAPLVRASQGDPNVLEFLKGMNANEKRAEAHYEKQATGVMERIEGALVDESAALKRALRQAGAKRAAERFATREGASAQADEMYRAAETKIDEALKGVDESLVSDIIHARRTVEATRISRERGVELKTPDMIGEKNSKAVLQAFENMDAPTKAKIQTALDEFDAFNRGNLDVLRDSGLISEQAHAKLMEEHKFYSPREFIDFIDPSIRGIQGARGNDSGIKALDEGSLGAMETNFKALMNHSAARVWNRAFRNRASRALLDFAESTPDNEVVRVRGANPDGSKTEIGRDEQIVSTFKDGQEIEMVMPKKLAEQWEGLPPALSPEVANLLQWASGTKIVKAVATGYNPEFALRNIIRDAQYAGFVSGQYSNFIPKMAWQQMGDYKEVYKAAKKAGGIKNTQEYKDYVAQGGGLDYLTTQGALGKKSFLDKAGSVKHAAEKIGNVLAWAGETSEIATRLAVRRRAIANGVDPESATFIARDMLDFAQGGRAAKAANNFIPYLNAAIQGTRGGMRAFKNDWKGSSLKAAQLMGIGSAMAYAGQALFPEIWNSISEENKARHWIIPLPWKTRDKKGELRGAYFSVPKDQFQQIFSAIGQSVVDADAGKPWSNQIMTSVGSMIPVDGSSMAAPIYNAYMAYFRNYDSWSGRDVWRDNPDVSPSMEITPTTPEMAQQVSRMANAMNIEISPERLSTAASKMVPMSNPIASMLLDLYNLPFDEEESSNIVETIKKTPGVRSLLRFSGTIEPRENTIKEAQRLFIPTEGKINQELIQEIKEAKRAEADLRAPTKLGLDKMLGQNPTIPEIVEYIAANAKSSKEQDALKRRVRSRRPDLFK